MEARSTIDAEGDYSPERIHWAIRHWEELSSAAEGGAAAPWGRTGSGGDRMAIAALLSDVRRAAQRVLAPYPHWTSARRIYSRIGLEVPPYRWPAGAPPAPLYPFSHQVLVEAIARELGWDGYASDRGESVTGGSEPPVTAAGVSRPR
jgi:hypothetical protein